MILSLMKSNIFQRKLRTQYHISHTVNAPQMFFNFLGALTNELPSMTALHSRFRPFVPLSVIQLRLVGFFNLFNLG